MGRGDLRGVDAAALAHEEAVAQEEDPVAGGGDVGVVRDDEDAAPRVVGDAGELAEDDLAGAGVEGSGGLVGEDDGRLLGEDARERHALLLAA